MRTLYVLCVSVGCLAGLPAARADVRSYCEAYARSQADGYLNGSAILNPSAAPGEKDWEIGKNLALAGCLAQYEAAPEQPQPQQEEPVVAEKPPQQTVTRAEIPAKPAAARNSGTLARGSAAWNASCDAKYASFDRKTGMYRSMTGKLRPCVLGKGKPSSRRARKTTQNTELR